MFGEQHRLRTCTHLGVWINEGINLALLLGEAVHCVFSEAAHETTRLVFHGPCASLIYAQTYCGHV